MKSQYETKPSSNCNPISSKMEVEHQKRIQEVKQSYEVEHRKQSEYIDKILRYFPYVEKLMPMIKYPQWENGFNDNLIKSIMHF